MAFGAAMIQTGIQSEVAATSFNNMIKALSRGPSMTERQTSALNRLGYSMVNAQAKERELTQVAEEQSRRRLEAARNETDQLSKEINRRYRNQLQALQDNWDDEAAGYEDGLQDRTNEQVKALQRQEEREIKAAQERAEGTGKSTDFEVQRIQDAYEKRIDAVRDATERELQLRRRANRNQQQQVKDELDDRKDLELKGVDDRFKEVERQEQKYLEESRANAKRLGEELASESTQGFADRLQQNAIGTITEVLKKISALPKSQQISVLSDLFGDEARGLAPLLSNLGELERILALAGDKGAYTGSVIDEFGVRSQTTANKLKLFRNNLDALAIAVGENILPALVKLAEFFGPIVKAVADFASKNTFLTTAVVALVSGFAGLVALAPFLSAFITLVGQLLPILSGIGAWFAGTKIAATIAGWLGVIGPVVTGITTALSGLLAWIGSTLIPGLLAFFSGPVGWTVLAVAAVVAMAIAFRKPLGDFIKWLWNWGEPIRKFWVDLWNSATTSASNAFKALGNAIKNVFRGILQSIANNINSISGLVNRLISSFNRLPGPDIPLVPMLSVPAFAKGGYVGGGTLAMVGEAGPEYIIPERKMMQASMNYLNGVRGGAVIPAYASGGYVGGNAQINVTTGPVMQQGGQQYVSMADLEKAMRKTADGIYASLRTPAGRYAVGVR
jgi:hypothetical protein